LVNEAELEAALIEEHHEAAEAGPSNPRQRQEPTAQICRSARPGRCGSVRVGCSVLSALLCTPMEAKSVELSQRERRVASSAVIVWAVGEVVLRVVGNTTGDWWPSFILLGAFLLFAAGFTMYLARTRNRSLGSLLVRALPDRLRSRHE
jgi:hypothetical protein